MKTMTEKVYRTDDTEHPGVAAFNTVGKFGISGPIQVLNYSYFADGVPRDLPHRLPDPRRDREGWLEQGRGLPDP